MQQKENVNDTSILQNLKFISEAGWQSVFERILLWKGMIYVWLAGSLEPNLSTNCCWMLYLNISVYFSTNKFWNTFSWWHEQKGFQLTAQDRVFNLYNLAVSCSQVRHKQLKTYHWTIMKSMWHHLYSEVGLFILHVSGGRRAFCRKCIDL